MSLSDYEIEKIIGKGSYGIVYKSKNKINNRLYALKKIDLQRLSHYENLNIVNELRILATHASCFIIRLKGAFLDKEALCLVTEYAEKGDLALLIKHKNKQNCHFSENEIWHYFLQISVAIAYLHKFNIIHRDIKPANIFIDKFNNVKLGDFGIVKIMRSYMMYGQTQIGTPLYMSPEIYKRERYDAKTDIWSLGCILYELIMLKPAFNADNILALKHKIFAGRFNVVYYTQYTKDLKDLVNKLINIHPRLRPSIQTVLDTLCVKRQLQMRNLDLEKHTPMKPSFYENCIFPKKIDDWKIIISQFVNDPNITVVHETDNERNLKIQEAAEKVANAMIEKKSRVGHLNGQIQKILVEITNAKQFILEREKVLNKLRNEKNSIASLNLPNISKPKPPSCAMPIHRSPRVLDIRPTPNKAQRLR